MRIPSVNIPGIIKLNVLNYPLLLIKSMTLSHTALRLSNITCLALIISLPPSLLHCLLVCLLYPQTLRLPCRRHLLPKTVLILPSSMKQLLWMLTVLGQAPCHQGDIRILSIPVKYSLVEFLGMLPSLLLYRPSVTLVPSVLSGLARTRLPLLQRVMSILFSRMKRTFLCSSHSAAMTIQMEGPGISRYLAGG